MTVIGAEPSDGERAPERTETIPLGDLVSRVVAEGRELAASEIARGRALVSERARHGVMLAIWGALALALGFAGLLGVAGAAVGALVAAGVGVGWAALAVGVLGLALAGWSGLAARRSATAIVAAPMAPGPSRAALEGARGAAGARSEHREIGPDQGDGATPSSGVSGTARAGEGGDGATAEAGGGRASGTGGPPTRAAPPTAGGPR